MIEIRQMFRNLIVIFYIINFYQIIRLRLVVQACYNRLLVQDVFFPKKYVCGENRAWINQNNFLNYFFTNSKKNS